MAAPKIITRQEWNVRALELAHEKHLIGTPSYHHECEYGHVWRVPSRSGKGSYDVLARHDGRVECPCVAGSYGRPCSHAGATVAAEKMRQEARDGPSDAWSWWLAGGEW